MAVPAAAIIVTTSWLVASLVAQATAPAARLGAGGTATASRAAPGPHPAPRSPGPAGRGPVASPRARRSCPAAASACADLSDHITWLQSAGRITYGPVRMEPGTAADPTPRGTFHVAWKAGAHYISTSYDEPIPYAVFFAPGGIAFHAGRLSTPSHGCIHLSMGSARYYHDHLPIGAEVAVF